MNAVVTQDTAVMVLGMHRSGTSVATRVLSLLGADLGENLLPPQEDNKKGFWEHVEAVDIHERFLASIGRTWHDVRELPRGWLDTPAALLALDEIAGLIRREFAGRRLWAVKDPRMCRLVPLWLTALQSLGIRATALVVVRDPIEVADSLLARDGWSRGHSYVLWTRHLAEALLATTGIPRAILSYGDLLNHWRPCMTRVAEQLGLQWTADLAQAGAAIDEFVSPEERHHDLVKESFRRSEIPGFVSELFHACSSTDGMPDWPALEAACSKFQYFSSLFEPTLEETIQARNNFGQLAHERMLRIQQLDQDAARISIERGSLELLAVERLERVKQLEAEYRGKIEQQARIEGHLASVVESRAEALAQAAVAQEIALRAQEETARVRDEMAKLAQLTRSRRWLIRRALGAAT